MLDISDALCAQTDPDLFFPETEINKSIQARQLCVQCPLMESCLRESLGQMKEHDWGIWGGSTPQQRRRINRGLATVEQILNEIRKDFDPCFSN
jgi:WhiB family redox-sensing transcriptional regulator